MKSINIVLLLIFSFIIFTSQTCQNTPGAVLNVNAYLAPVKCPDVQNIVQTWNSDDYCNWDTPQFIEIPEIWPYPYVNFFCIDNFNSDEGLHPFSSFYTVEPGGILTHYSNYFILDRVQEATADIGSTAHFKVDLTLHQNMGSTSVNLDWCSCCKECNLKNLVSGETEFDMGALYFKYYETYEYEEFSSFTEQDFYLQSMTLQCPNVIGPGHSWHYDTCPPG